MNVSGEVADLMVKESMQVTEETVKLLATGSKNLAAFLWALAHSEKKLSGKSSTRRLLREGKELKVFRIREEDLDDFKKFGKKNILYSVVKDKRSDDGTVDLVTNTDFVSQVNLFMERHGYGAPSQEAASKKGEARARQDSSSIQRGNGLQASNQRTRTTTSDKPSVKSRLEALRAASKDTGGKAPQRGQTKRNQSR